ncbi:YncE family protein [Bacillus carboniphilus]|uniref:YncE family protein n=1 Tax=Bacillus carboniphilus TaxID=86663 RepID=A0ABY9JSY9_9BACI|nr:YncE family protein [Bacillus carboniphilus]WLR42506.1 YncE family protein [Bacillus carboniphilus]
MSILYTTGPIFRTNLELVFLLVRNTDPSNSASVSVRFFDENSSPETLVNSVSFTVNANSTERFESPLTPSFLIEVEIDLANRSDTTTTAVVQPTLTAFEDATSEFDQFIRLFVSSPKVLQDIDYPITPQLNLFLPDIINCEGQISGDVSFNGVPQAGVDVSFTAETSGVSFVPNPATTDMNGNYVTSVVVTPPKPLTKTAITASATVNGQIVQSVGVTEVVRLLLYVTNFGSNNVSVINASTNMVVDTITGITNPTGIAANSVTGLVYVANQTINVLSVIDATTNLIINTITAGMAVDDYGVAVNQNENLIYLANNVGSTLTIIDGTSNIIIDTVTIAPTAKSVAVDQQRNLIYVTSQFLDIVSVIDGDNGFVITATVTLGVILLQI